MAFGSDRADNVEGSKLSGRASNADEGYSAQGLSHGSHEPRGA
jgi:hypothetical protein